MRISQVVASLLALAALPSHGFAEQSGFLKACLNADEYEDFAGTIAACQNDAEIQKLDPKSKAMVFWQIGTSYHWVQDFASAVVSFDQSIAFDTSNGQAYNQRGWSKYNLGDNVGAEADFLRAIELLPTFGNPYLGMALVKSAAGDDSAELEWYVKMSAVAPEYRLGQYNYTAELIELGRSAEALVVIDKVLANPEAALEKVEVMRTADEKEKGLNFLAFALVMRADALLGLGRTSEAKEIYNRLVSQWPKNTDYEETLSRL
jgi:tetratricopeptide (TPR) repeat protein